MDSKLAAQIHRATAGKASSPHNYLRESMGRQLQPWAASGAIGFGENWWTVASGSLFPESNMSLIYGAEEACLDSALEVVARLGVPSVVVLSDAGLAQVGRVLDRGFAFITANPLMAISLESNQAQYVLADGLEVLRIDLASDIDVIRRLLHESFEMPMEMCNALISPELVKVIGVYFWLLLDQGQPVATVTTTFEESILGIKAMATPPNAQRKGYGHALLSYVLQEHAKAGQLVGILAATPAGLPLYQRLGFEVIGYGQIFAGRVSPKPH